MAVAYDDIYSDGNPDLTAGATWGANGKVLLPGQTQTISTNLDVSTNAIDLVHILGGAPRINGWTVKIDNTYTTDPNFVWTGGGYSSVTFSTNACPLAIISGGTHVINAGTVSHLVVAGGQVTIGASATITALTLVAGVVDAYAAIATVRQGGGRLNAHKVRIGATSYTLAGGSGYIENTSGSACTALTQSPGSAFHPIDGDVATYTRHGGVIGYASAIRDVDLGSTAFVNYGGGTPSATGNVSISNLTDFSAYIGGSGVPIPGGK